MRSPITIRATLLVTLFVLAVAGGSAYLVWHKPKAQTARPYSTFTISSRIDRPAPQSSGAIDWTVRTESIPELLPHEHEPGAADGSHAVFPPTIPLIVPEDVWITGFTTEVLNADQRVLHHATLYAGGLPDILCPGSGLTPDIYASSAYVTKAGLPAPYAVFLPKGTELLLSPMLHNPEPPLGPGGSYKNVSIAVHLQGVVATADSRYKPAEFLRLRIDNRPCTTANPFQVFQVPATTSKYIISTKYDTATTSSASFIFPKAGVILGFGANFWPQKGGQWVAGYLNGKEVVKLAPTQAPAQTPWEISIPPAWKTVPFKAGDVLRVEAEYDNSNTYVIPDATAHLGTYISYDP